MHIKNNYKTKYKFVVTLEWWYRGSPEEHYEYSLIQPYKKAFKPYIPYCVVGGAGADGVEITGYPTLKQAILAPHHCFSGAVRHLPGFPMSFPSSGDGCERPVQESAEYSSSLQ